MKKTRIIAIEGIDGSGKGVQYRLLRDALLARGYTVETRDFPAYESFFGQEIGKLLSGAEGTRADEVDGKSMALWFALDRMESFPTIGTVRQTSSSSTAMCSLTRSTRASGISTLASRTLRTGCSILNITIWGCRGRM